MSYQKNTKGIQTPVFDVIYFVYSMYNVEIEQLNNNRYSKQSLYRYCLRTRQMCGIINAAKNVVPFCTTFILLSFPPFHIHRENILFKLNEIIFCVKILLLLVSVLLTYSVVQKSLALFLLYWVKLNVHTQYIILPRRTQLDYTFQSTVHSTHNSSDNVNNSI